MIGWHDRLNGHEFQATGVGDGQGGLACCMQSMQSMGLKRVGHD